MRNILCAPKESHLCAPFTRNTPNVTDDESDITPNDSSDLNNNNYLYGLFVSIIPSTHTQSQLQRQYTMASIIMRRIMEVEVVAVMVVVVASAVLSITIIASSPILAFPIDRTIQIHPHHIKHNQKNQNYYQTNKLPLQERDWHFVDTKTRSTRYYNRRISNHHIDNIDDCRTNDQSRHSITQPTSPLPSSEPNNHRRSLLRQMAFLTISSSSNLLVLPHMPVNAFDNKISNQYDDRPKRRGPKVRTCFTAINIFVFWQSLYD